jgi:mycothiol synthase
MSIDGSRAEPPWQMTARPPEGLRPRFAAVEDVETIADLVNDVTRAEIGVPWTDAGQIRDDLTAPTRVAGLEDLVLVDPSGGTAGYLGFWVMSSEPSEIFLFVCVRPDLSGRGVNAWLLRYGEGRAMEHHPSDEPLLLSVGRFLGNEAAGGLFEALGYAYARTFRMMRLDLDAPPHLPAVPEGITIRSFDRRADERRTFEAFSEAFADHWGAPFPSFEEWRHHEIDGEGADFHPDLWFVALDGDKVVGALAARPSTPRAEQTAYVSGLAVRRPWRNRGVAFALLCTVFVAIHARGIARVELSVDADNATGATRLYERAGMRFAVGWEVWQKKR